MADEQFVVELKIDLNAKDLRAELSTALGGLNESVTGFDQKIAGVQKSLNGAADANKKFSQNLSTTRYALYDVSATLGIMGGALLGIAVGTEAVAIAWERDFANVVRTSGVVGKEVANLRTQFVDLAQTLPAAFGDITKIGTLGAQLGIASDDLSAFTKTVLQFSAATGISAEESAQAFGRLGNILGLTADQYDNLGSSIVKAGVSAVATEAEIVAVAQQIGPIARLAGASASEVVGLATAFASVKIPPELARSVITKTFGDIQRAVATASPKLEEFGKVTGQSGKEFAAAWNKDATGAFVKLLQGIPKDANGAVIALDAMGLSSQRNTPALLKLAQNTDLVRKSLSESKTGFDQNSELARQFGIISETTAAKLQVLANNFQALLDAIGSANLGPLNDVLDNLSGFLGFLTDFASTDVGGQILGWAVALTALAGVLGVVGAGMALFGASSIGMLQALEGLAVIAPRATAAVLGTGTASALAAGEMRAGALSAKLLGTALKALSLITIVLALPDIAKWAADTQYQLSGFQTSASETAARVKKDFQDGLFASFHLEDLDEFGAGVTRFFSAFDAHGVKDVQKTDEAIRDLAKSGAIDAAQTQLDDLKNTWVDGGGSLKAFAALFPDATNALKDYKDEAAAGGGTEQLNADLQATQEEAQATQDAIDALRDAILNFGNTSISVEESQIKLSQAFNAMTEAADAEGASLTGANAASLELRQSYIDIDQAARDAAIAIIENGGSVEEATAKYYESRDAIVASRVAKGEDEASARAWADKILGTSGEATAAIAAYADSYKKVPPKAETLIFANTTMAQSAVNAFIANVNSRVASITVRATMPDLNGSVSGSGRPGLATGGPVYGPGSGTSDSINARLSNGEYVIRAAAVKQFGVGYFNALNQGRKPRGFASGGAVNAAPSAPSMMGGVVELGPRSMARLTQSVINNINIDDVAISRASQSGDAKRRSTGDL